MNNDLMLVHRALCSPFVDEHLFRQSLGGTRGDLGTIGRYLSIPVLQRPVLSVYFDREFYLATNPDIQGRGIDPLLHFLEIGLRALRAPHPLIDIEFIVSDDSHALGDPPNIDRLLDLLELRPRRPEPVFRPRALRAHRCRRRPHRGNVAAFPQRGPLAGRTPNAHLDPAWYAAAYDDVPKDPYGALRHFLVLGDVEGRAAGPEFDGRLYRSRYPDVASAGVPPLRHFMTHGRYREAPGRDRTAQLHRRRLARAGRATSHCR